jgi:uncharacterized protein (TIGR00251 family)
MMPRMRRAILVVRVQPRARSDVLVGLREGVIVVRVAAPPLDGRANDAVCRLLARAIGTRTASVTILRGERARDKVIAINGVDQATADAAIRAAVDGSSVA